MDMIRWLATNKVVLAVWGLGALAIALAGIFGGKKAEHETAAVETKVVEAAVEVTKPAAVVAATATAAVAATAQAAVGTATEATTEAVSDASAEVNTAAENVTEATTSAVSETETVAASESNSATETETATTSESGAGEAAMAQVENLADKSSDDLLMMAREAYWDNGLDKAAGLYAELITREPTVIEHKGELGNVFWRQGYPKKAAELYADIAEPMIATGNSERVSNMVGFIGLFFPDRAADIRKLLDAQ
ncbi:MAG: hypothetical protein ACPG47_04420 [Leucothrix sp.]